MKKKTFTAALLAIAFAFLVSCNRTQKRKADTSDPLVGKWRIDTIQPGNDSTALGHLFLAFSRNDSLNFDYEFRKDSVTFYGKRSTETTKYTLDTVKKELVLGDSTEHEVYRFNRLNDSTVALIDKDSAVILLMKR